MSINELYEKYPNIDWDKVKESFGAWLILFVGNDKQNYFDEYKRYSDNVLTHEQSEFYRTGKIRMTDCLEY